MGKEGQVGSKERKECLFFLGYVRMCEKNVSIGTWCECDIKKNKNISEKNCKKGRIIKYYELSSIFKRNNYSN
jgi:hypothetical protein